VHKKRVKYALKFLGNAGGLLSLTLGFSIISFIELIYFFTLRAWFQYKSLKKDDDLGGQNRDRRVSESEQEKVSRKLAFNHNHVNVKMPKNDSWAVRNRFGGRKSNQTMVMPAVEQSEKQISDFQILSGPKNVMYRPSIIIHDYSFKK